MSSIMGHPGRQRVTNAGIGGRPSRSGWEHLVLEHLQAHLPGQPIQFWRDKAGQEVDFIIHHGRDRVDAIECKWNSAAFDPSALKLFRSRYPDGRNFLITPTSLAAHARRYGDLEIKVGDLSSLGHQPTA
jgi:hypothetical protein